VSSLLLLFVLLANSPSSYLGLPTSVWNNKNNEPNLSRQCYYFSSLFSSRAPNVYRWQFLFSNINKTGNISITGRWDSFVQPLLQRQSNKCYLFWVYICSLRYLAWNSNAPYCHLWPAPLYTIFPHFTTKGTIFGEKKLLSIKCVLWLYLQRLSETFSILGKTERDMIKHVYWSSCEVPLLFCDFNETWFFSTEFRKILKYQISWKFVL
jgi:hypothetical protein